MEVISSRQNPHYKKWLDWSRGNASANRGLREAGLCWLEGEHLVEACIATGGTLHALLTGPHTVLPSRYAAVSQTVLEKDLLSGLLQQADSSVVVGLAHIPKVEAHKRVAGTVLALDGVQDPGNVGAILRSAAAFGVSEIWLGHGCAWAWSAKTLRASQGCQFGLRVREELDLTTELRALKMPVLALDASGAQSLDKVDLRGSHCLVVGSEGQGLSPAVSETVTQSICIPMQTGVESLNAAIACSVVLYERQRQMLV